MSIASLAACSDSPSDPGDPDAITVTLTAANRFSPADVTVDAGQSVRWVNAAAILHTITPDDPTAPGVWGAATSASAGLALTHTFTQADRNYAYFCEPHLAEGMTGIIRVR